MAIDLINIPEGFEGLNINRAISQIDNFCSEANNIKRNLEDAIITFFKDISIRWGSPNAVEFSALYTKVFENLMIDLANQITNIASEAVEAGITLAAANGTTFPYEAPRFTARTGYIMCKDNVDGATGMAVENVKIIRDTFNIQIQTGLSNLNVLDRSIDFYSINDSLAYSYGSNISEFVKEAELEIKDAMNKLNDYIGTETNNIELAKQRAYEAMT